MCTLIPVFLFFLFFLENRYILNIYLCMYIKKVNEQRVVRAYLWSRVENEGTQFLAECVNVCFALLKIIIVFLNFIFILNNFSKS